MQEENWFCLSDGSFYGTRGEKWAFLLGGAWPRQRRDQVHRSRPCSRRPEAGFLRTSWGRKAGSPADMGLKMCQRVVSVFKRCAPCVCASDTHARGESSGNVKIARGGKEKKKRGNEHRIRCPATGWLVHAQGRRGSRGSAPQLCASHPSAAPTPTPPPPIFLRRISRPRCVIGH